MKTSDIAILGILGVVGYFVWKGLSGGGSGVSYGGGGGGSDTGTSPPGGNDYTGGWKGSPQGRMATGQPVSVAHATIGGADIGVPYNPNTGVVYGRYAGNYTTGSPYQQNTQYSTGPKVVIVNGKSMKVM